MFAELGLFSGILGISGILGFLIHVGPAEGFHDATSKLVVCEEARFKEGSIKAASYENEFFDFSMSGYGVFRC